MRPCPGWHSATDIKLLNMQNTVHGIFVPAPRAGSGRRVSGRSLRLRLVAAGGAAVLGALTIAAVGLAVLFERHVERLAADELAAHLDQLAAGIERGPDGALVVAQPPADPRYRRPLSGRYWQVEAGGATLASRSLWDALLALPPAAGTPGEFRLAGPEGEDLLVVERRLTLPPSLGGGPATVAVAMDHAELRAASQERLRGLAQLGVVHLHAAHPPPARRPRLGGRAVSRRHRKPAGPRPRLVGEAGYRTGFLAAGGSARQRVPERARRSASRPRPPPASSAPDSGRR